MEYIPKHQRRTNNPFYENRPSNENTTSSLPKTNNQTIDDAKYKFDDIINIYDKFLTLQENNVLVIIKPEHIRKTLQNGAIIEDKWIDKTLIVENIIPSYKNDITISYLTVSYYDDMDSLNRIANGESVEPNETKLEYKQQVGSYIENNPTKYKNGFFINDYKIRHQNAIQQKRDYENRKLERQAKSPSMLSQKRKNQIKPEQSQTTIQKTTASDLIQKYGSHAAVAVAILAALATLYSMSSSQNGGGPEDSNPQSELSDLSEEELKDLLKEIKPGVNIKALKAEISNLPESEQKAVKEKASEYFSEFNLEEGETVFGNLFRTNGGKRKRTNKKRKSNKRKNNKKKSNRR